MQDDPVVHHNYSPYSAFDNNPVFWADPSGANSETSAMSMITALFYVSIDNETWNNNNDGTFSSQLNGNTIDISTGEITSFGGEMLPEVVISASAKNSYNAMYVGNHIDSYIQQNYYGATRMGVGQPGEYEALIPIWGSGRASIDHFENGNYWRGTGYLALAVSDVFLVKPVATGIGKGVWKLGSHSWSATRKWMVKNGYAGKGEPLHHWAITQATAKKHGIEALANQPWNLLKFSSQSMHMRAGHGHNYLGEKRIWCNRTIMAWNSSIAKISCRFIWR